MARLAALLLLACLPGLTAAAEPAARRYPVREALDLRYGNGSRRQSLDVFAPKGSASERFPVVLFVHGGTWMVGDKNFFGIYRGVGRTLARHGIVAVMTNYRLSPLVRHPEHVKDVARAYAWVCRHIDRHGGDPDRIILAGHSSGGHLAALLATDRRYLEDPALKLTPRNRKALKGVICLSGVYRVPAPEEFRVMVARIVRSLVGDAGRPGLAMVLGPVLRSVGERVNPFALVFGTSRDVQSQASPLTHVRKGLPPFLLLTAEYEVPRLADMADDFAAALRKAGTKVTQREIEGCSHRTLVNRLHDDDHEATQLILNFVRRHAAAPPKGGT
jgi:acetyl esterase/lipase